MNRVFVLIATLIPVIYPAIVLAQLPTPPGATTAFTDVAFREWQQKVAALPVEKQIEAVAIALRERNPDSTGKFGTPSSFPPIGEEPVQTFWGRKDNLADICPFRAFASLSDLDLSDTRVADLSPLEGMSLERLKLSNTKIASLSPLRGMPLASLYVDGTQVSDLSPLYDCKKLWYVNVARTGITAGEVEALKNALPTCDIEWDEPMPPIVTYKDAAFQKWIDKVAVLPADEQYKAVVEKLKELNPRIKGVHPKSRHDEKGVITELAFDVDKITDLSPVRALKGLTKLVIQGADRSTRYALYDLSPLSGMTLTSLDVSFTRVTDLSPLRGMPLTKLNLSFTDVADLSPLKGMQLTKLACYETKVADLSPLRGMPLTDFNCSRALVPDLSPLEGMKLTYLSCSGIQSDMAILQGMPLVYLVWTDSPVSDLSPLKGMELWSLDCSRTNVSDLSPLRGMDLAELACSDTKVIDLLPLEGMDLAILYCANTPISDLAPLAKCKQIGYASFEGTKVTEAAVEALRRARPDIGIDR